MDPQNVPRVYDDFDEGDTRLDPRALLEGSLPDAGVPSRRGGTALMPAALGAADRAAAPLSSRARIAVSPHAVVKGGLKVTAVVPTPRGQLEAVPARPEPVARAGLPVSGREIALGAFAILTFSIVVVLVWAQFP